MFPIRITDNKIDLSNRTIDKELVEQIIDHTKNKKIGSIMLSGSDIKDQAMEPLCNWIFLKYESLTRLDLTNMHLDQLKALFCLFVAKLEWGSLYIEHLNLANNNFDDGAKQQLESFLNEISSSIECLDLSQNNLSSNDLKIFANILQHALEFRILLLSNNKLDDNCGDFLSNIRKLKKIDISGNPLSLDTFIKLTSETLEDLNFANIKFAYRGPGQVIKETLKNSKVKKLNLSGSNLHENENLFDLFKPPCKTLQIERLNLSGNIFTENNFHNFLNTIANSPKLDTLILTNTDITDAHTQNTPKESAHLSISSLNLSNNKIGSLGAIFFIKRCPKLTDINFAYNNLSDEQLEKILWSLKELKDLCELDLSGNHFGEKTSKALAELLKKNQKFTKINLSGCKITANSVDPIVRALENQKKLKILDLSNNPIDDNSINLLTAMLANTTNLEELYLGKTAITTIAANELAKWLPNQQKLEILELINNNIGYDGFKALDDVLKANPQLCRPTITGIEPIDVSLNDIQDDKISNKTNYEVPAGKIEATNTVIAPKTWLDGRLYLNIITKWINIAKNACGSDTNKIRALNQIITQFEKNLLQHKNVIDTIGQTSSDAGGYLTSLSTLMQNDAFAKTNEQIIKLMTSAISSIINIIEGSDASIQRKKLFLNQVRRNFDAERRQQYTEAVGTLFSCQSPNDDNRLTFTSSLTPTLSRNGEVAVTTAQCTDIKQRMFRGFKLEKTDAASFKIFLEKVAEESMPRINGSEQFYTKQHPLMLKFSMLSMFSNDASDTSVELNSRISTYQKEAFALLVHGRKIWVKLKPDYLNIDIARWPQHTSGKKEAKELRRNTFKNYCTKLDYHIAEIITQELQNPHDEKQNEILVFIQTFFHQLGDDTKRRDEKWQQIKESLYINIISKRNFFPEKSKILQLFDLIQLYCEVQHLYLTENRYPNEGLSMQLQARYLLTLYMIGKTVVFCSESPGKSADLNNKLHALLIFRKIQNRFPAPENFDDKRIFRHLYLQTALFSAEHLIHPAIRTNRPQENGMLATDIAEAIEKMPFEILEHIDFNLQAEEAWRSAKLLNKTLEKFVTDNKIELGNQQIEIINEQYSLAEEPCDAKNLLLVMRVAESKQLELTQKLEPLIEKINEENKKLWLLSPENPDVKIAQEYQDKLQEIIAEIKEISQRQISQEMPLGSICYIEETKQKMTDLLKKADKLIKFDSKENYTEETAILRTNILTQVYGAQVRANKMTQEDFSTTKMQLTEQQTQFVNALLTCQKLKAPLTSIQKNHAIISRVIARQQDLFFENTTFTEDKVYKKFRKNSSVIWLLITPANNRPRDLKKDITLKANANKAKSGSYFTNNDQLFYYFQATDRTLPRIRIPILPSYDVKDEKTKLQLRSSIIFAALACRWQDINIDFLKIDKKGWETRSTNNPTAQTNIDSYVRERFAYTVNLLRNQDFINDQKKFKEPEDNNWKLNWRHKVLGDLLIFGQKGAQEQRFFKSTGGKSSTSTVTEFSKR